MRISKLATLALVSCLGSTATLAQTGAWRSGFGVNRFDGSVKAVVSVPGANGATLYAGGTFATINGQPRAHIARWDGSAWQSVGAGFDGDVNALTVFDDGHGPSLFAAGAFSSSGASLVSGIARWDGVQWQPVDIGLHGVGMAMTVYDDGSGPALFVGGAFSQTTAPFARCLAKWDGTSWSDLASTTMNGEVDSLKAFDDGTGLSLFVGGGFFAPALPFFRTLAKWNGSSWSWLSVTPNERVDALEVFDDGTGPALFVGGEFDQIGNRHIARLAKWDGAMWTGLFDSPAEVYALATFDDGTGAKLAVGGEFVFGPVLYDCCVSIGLWNGSNWTSLGTGVRYGNASVVWGRAYALCVHDGGDGKELITGGMFDVAGGSASSSIARWKSNSWHALGNGNGVSASVHALTVHDDGGGPALIAGGVFAGAGNHEVRLMRHVASWNGAEWSSLDGGVFGDDVRTLATFDDSHTGANTLVVGGGLSGSASGIKSDLVAGWSRLRWHSLHHGVSLNLGVKVNAVMEFGDGSDDAIYACGWFSAVGHALARNVARWDGEQWAPLGLGLGGNVNCLVSYRAGSTSSLYAGGSMSAPSGGAATPLARWDGSEWHHVVKNSNGAINTMAVRNGLAGELPTLIVGGSFTKLNGVDAAHIASWDGTTWRALGNGLNGNVRVLAAVDVVGRQLVFAGGDFTIAGGVAAANIACWDGQSWSALSEGTDQTVYALAAYDDGAGPSLFVGGDFHRAGVEPSEHIAAWTLGRRP